MKYSELISVNENFQYSVNLQFDINNISKLKEYIPTKDGCEVLKFYFNSILNGKNRSTTLIGPYGKGKSHLLLVLITLLNNYNNEEKCFIDEFISKVKKVDEELYEMLIKIRKDKIKLMPIIINSNYDDLNQAFLLALSEAMEREKLDKIIVNTYFDVALKVLEKWEEQYKDAISNVKKCLNEYNCNLKELKLGLKSYSHKYYDIFKNVYSCILHGQEFSPLVNADIIKTYKDITYEIGEYGYTGIYIVFDEFSKFLECIDNGRMMKDLKLLQDFAELASRSGKEEQIHLNCITHKTINEYIKNFKDDKVNAFKTVEGRFKEIYFNRSLEQNYEIVSYALNKKENFNKFYELFISKNKDFYKKVANLNIFKSVNNIEEVLFKGCFPLNPITVYSLIGLSEKIAQNERTLFTFLTDDDSNSLKSFIYLNNSGLFGIDKIYDYFRPLLKKENDELIKSIWIKTENSLLKASNDTEKSILKSLGIIYMINELEVLVPDDITLCSSLKMDEKVYNLAINNLIDKSVIKRRKITNDLDFSTMYNRELTKEIKTLCETKFFDLNEKETINKIIDSGYSLPRRYNEEYKITRFFKNLFMTEEELNNINNFDLLFEEIYCDGLVINLIRTSRNIQNIRDKFKMINNNKTILRIPKTIFNKTILNLLREYEAISYLKSTNESSSELSNELELMQNEIIEAVSENINEYFSKENIQEYIYKSEEKKNINNLSSYLSDICEKIYYDTPIINNEMINKRDLTPPIKKARNVVIDTILTNDLSLISSPTSAEATIYKAIVEKKTDKSVNKILNIINDFIEKSDNNKISFKELYDILESEPISMRKGIIPVLIAISLYNFADNIIIYFMTKEIDLDSNNLVKINENPEKYFILTEKGTTDKVKYLSGLMEIFDIRNVDNTRVNLKKLIDAMKRWVLSLPRILREANQIDCMEIKEEYLKIKAELLKPDMNNNEFIYKGLMEIFNTDDYYYIINEINNMKNNFDNFILTYSNNLIEKTKNILNNDFRGSLTPLLKEWYEKMDISNLNVIYDLKTRDFIQYVETLTSHDEFDVIEKIAKIVTGYYIEDWQTNEINNYFEYFKNLNSNIKDKSKNNEFSDSKIMLIKGNEKIEKNLSSNMKISALGNTMKNNIEELIDEYGDSLNETEKVNILLDIMKKYL